MSVNEVYNNTLLLPVSDGLGKKDNLEAVNQKDGFYDALSKYQENLDLNQDAVLKKDFSIKLTSDGKTSNVIKCQNVQGLSVTRNVEEKYSGGNPGYAVKLPGDMKYANVTFSHLFTNSKIFLNWMINGTDFNGPVSKNGALLANIDIYVGGSSYAWYELRDAFPVEWKLGKFDAEQPFMQNGEVPVEILTVAYGKLAYGKVPE